MDAKVSIRTACIGATVALLVGITVGCCIFSAGQNRAERGRIEELAARNAELEQRIVDNNRRARDAVGRMAVNLERQLQLADGTAGLVGALREVLEGLQDYYDSIGIDNSGGDTGGSTGGGSE